MQICISSCFLFVYNVVSIDNKGQPSNSFGFNSHYAYLEQLDR